MRVFSFYRYAGTRNTVGEPGRCGEQSEMGWPRRNGVATACVPGEHQNPRRKRNGQETQRN